MPRAPLPWSLARVSATERITSCVWQTPVRPPTSGGLCGKALGHIQKPLIGAAPEAQGDIVLGFHKAAVHQNIQQAQQLVGDLTAGRAGNTAGQLLPGVTGIAPDALIRVQRPEVADKGQQLPLILRLKRLTTQQGDACNIVGWQDAKISLRTALSKG